MNKKLLICSLMLAGFILPATIIADDGECATMTWYGGAAGKKGKTVKAKIFQPDKITYDWKNGKIDYEAITMYDGAKFVGLKGTWKQDGASGTLQLDGSFGEPMKGTWTSKGKKDKNKLELNPCK